VAEFLFWACAAFIFYAYLGYPMGLWLLTSVRSRTVRCSDITPRVSLIIAARNEEARIRAKIENTLALDYPPSHLEVIVASDCSTDATHDILKEYAGRRIRLVVSPERSGKEFAQRQAIWASTMDILVFSDVATELEPHSLRKIVRNFADPTVGCVSSEDRLIGHDGHVSGEGAYVRYEMLLRTLETKLGSVVGLSGSFFAARREMCKPWAIDLPSDFTTLLNTLRHGLRGISDPASIGYYRDLADRRREYSRKVRTIVRGMSALLRHLELLNPFQYGLFSWQLFSHKLCRWLVPFAMVGLLVSNLLLIPQSGFYATVGVAHLAAYGIAVSDALRQQHPSGVRRILSFLVLANLSILSAWFDLLRGRRFVTWEPSRR
jgi:cellulose synthase/poly-beta-1,6-N-acetylglucosamine synthase-like glycosyltransferase